MAEIGEILIKCEDCGKSFPDYAFCEYCKVCVYCCSCGETKSKIRSESEIRTELKRLEGEYDSYISGASIYTNRFGDRILTKILILKWVLGEN